MFSERGRWPLTFRRLACSELEAIGRLEFETGQMERFLGPLAEVIDAVRAGPAHHMIGIEVGGTLAGFYVIHPDARDRACWWLAWFAIDRRWQGAGHGGAVMRAIILRLRQVPGCRMVRLLVAPDNAAALRLYRRAGFVSAGVFRETGELILRCVLAAGVPSAEVPLRFWANAILMQVIAARTCRLGVPVAAQLHGEVAHPP
jgi:diamine N-acetyltransferase